MAGWGPGQLPGENEGRVGVGEGGAHREPDVHPFHFGVLAR